MRADPEQFRDSFEGAGSVHYHAAGFVVGGLFAVRQPPMARLGNTMLALDQDAASVSEAIRLRNALDPLLVEDALMHAADADITALRTHLERMEAAAEAGNGIAFVHANWALHARIAETSPSQLLRPFYLGLLELIEAHTLSVSASEDAALALDLRPRCRLHADLVDAIADRDLRALDIIRAHNTSPPADPDATC